MNRRAGYQAALAFTVLLGVSTAAMPQEVSTAAPGRESVIYRFKGGRDGSVPVAGLLMDAFGSLYGTTSKGGGSPNFGTVFELNPPAEGQTLWDEIVLHRSLGPAAGDAGDFDAGLATDPAGLLYGTSARGGLGNGTVFQVTEASETEKLLYQFLDGFDAATPVARLIRDKHGVLYGTTMDGGGSGNGTVFRLTPPARVNAKWIEQVLYRFAGSPKDGEFPQAGLLLVGADLFGTTAAGGSSGFGIVFRLSPPNGGTSWTEKVLYVFKGGTDGASPTADLIMDAKGNLYGTTFGGGNRAGFGTVFKLAPPPAGARMWTETVLHRFTGGADGAAPTAGVIADTKGDLFGTTRAGGTGCDCGTVFELSPPAAGGKMWTERVLYQFKGGADGATPAADLIADAKGILYGTTQEGGGTGCGGPGCGTVFRVVP